MTSLNHGLIYTDNGWIQRHILIKNKRIHRLSTHPLKEGNIINCQGRWILPGIIDSHVHFRTPGHQHKEDWSTASKAALSSGVTTVLDMPNNQPSITSRKILNQKSDYIHTQAQIHFGLYFGATLNNLDEISLAQKQIVAVKVYFGSSTGNLLVNNLNYLQQMIESISVPIAIHSEEESQIQNNLQQYPQSSFINASSLLHGKIRDEKVALSATESILKMLKTIRTPFKIYFCHISTRAEFELIQQYREELSNNQKIYCEVTPHHLFLNEENTHELGHLSKVNPPIRKESDRQFLHQMLHQGNINTVATDHAPHQLSEKQQNNYQDIPAGMPGVETLLPLLINEVIVNKLSMNILLSVLCKNPANIFGLKKKAYIQPGFDADLIIINPEQSHSINKQMLYTKSGWSPFEGKTYQGKVERTFIHGQLAYQLDSFFSVFPEQLSYQA